MSFPYFVLFSKFFNIFMNLKHNTEYFDSKLWRKLLFESQAEQQQCWLNIVNIPAALLISTKPASLLMEVAKFMEPLLTASIINK